MISNKVASIVHYRGDVQRLIKWARRLPQRLSEEEITRLWTLRPTRFVLWSLETGLIIY